MLLFPFQKSSVNNIKDLATFYKTSALDILKTNTTFINPDEHDFDVQSHWSWFKHQDLRHTNVEKGAN